MNLHTARGARGSRSPGSAHNRKFRVPPGGWRAEFVAGAVVGLLAALAALGWCAAPGDEAATFGAPGPATDSTPYQFTATAVQTGGLVGATALILGLLILGAALVGRISYSPTRKRR